jgi:hypothetical protein
MSKKFTSPAEFVKTYQPIQGSYAARLSDFLLSFGASLPYRFVDIGTCVKIALGLSRIPNEESPDYKRFSSVIPGANRILMKQGKEIITDRVDGLRASVNEDDLIETKHRRKRRRVKLAVASLKQTDNLIDPSKVKNPELKKELTASRRSMNLLETALSSLPQLPAKKTAD